MDRSTLGNFINMVKQQQGNNFDPEVAVRKSKRRSIAWKRTF